MGLGLGTRLKPCHKEWSNQREGRSEHYSDKNKFYYRKSHNFSAVT